MKKIPLYRKALLTSVIYVVFFILPGILPASVCSFPFDIDLKPSSTVPKSGNVDIELRIIPKFECKDIQVHIETYGNISIGTNRTWIDQCRKNQTLEYHFTVVIPDQDTTGFEVKVQSGEIWHHAFLYFVTTGRKTEVYPGNPKYHISNPGSELKIPVDLKATARVPLNIDLTETLTSRIDKRAHNGDSENLESYDKKDPVLKEVTGTARATNEDTSQNAYTWGSSLSIDEIRNCEPDPDSSYTDAVEKKNNESAQQNVKMTDFVIKDNPDRRNEDRNTIFYDNFSGSYPGSWYIGHDGGGGNFTWAWPNPYAHCYSNPSGGQYYYPDNLHVFMERRNVSLSGYDSAVLSFYKIVDTEYNYDEFTVNVRDQSGSWYCIYAESGIADPFDWEYLELTLDYFAGQSGLYIQFRFDSDGSVSGNPYDGVFIDNVSLDAWTTQLPNLTPYQPSGWDYKIVPSSVSGTHTVNTLYADQTTYIDWAIMNNGTANINQTFYTRLYIDNIYITQWSTNSLLSNYYAYVEDYTRTLSSGYHTLKIITDYYDDINESDETDNQYSRQFYWVAPSLPNLKPYTPTGWSYPITPSSVTGTHTLNTLYADQDTYIDWAIENDGDANVSQTFYTRLYIDNVYITQWSTNSLQVDHYAYIEDYVSTLSSGNHTLKIITDYYDDVEESDETDNEYSRQFYWEASGTLVVSGRVRFHDHNPYTIKDGKRLKVEIWDDDTTSGDDLLWSGWTDNQGYFTSTAFNNTEPLQGTQDIYVKIFAQNEASIVKNGVDGTTYCLITDPPIVNVPHGSFNFGTLMPASVVHDGAFFIADTILTGFDTWSSYVPGTLNDVAVVYPNDPSFLVGTYYSPTDNFIMICGNDDANHGYPDTFDEDVILHEYGHRIEDVYNFYDASEGGGHAWDDEISLGLAASEGFAHYWSSRVRNSHLLYNWWLDNNGSYTNNNCFNLENGDWLGNGGYLVANANSLGSDCEASVAGMLWDLHDYADDDQNNDGIGDTYDNGSSNIINTLVNRTVSGHHPDNSDEFWTAWFSTPSLGSDQQLWAIWYEHGDNKDTAAPNTPVITSCSHSLSTWSDDNTINISWSCSDSGPSGIAGYSYDWIQSAYAIPNDSMNGTASSTTSPQLSYGSNWYFHVKAKDRAGNWSNTRHYGPFYIEDILPAIPVIVSCSHTHGEWNNDNTISIQWTSSDYRSSYIDSVFSPFYEKQESLTLRSVSGYSFEWSQSASTIPNNTSQGLVTSTTSPQLSNANNWYFHVKAVNQNGNWGNALHYGPFYIDDAVPGIPSIVSCSHTPELWDNDDTIYVSWNCFDTGGSGISGYSYEWSQASSTAPDNTSQGSATYATSPSLANASNWYFHVKAQDHAGNWSSTKHYGPFYIDDTLPGIPSIVSCSHTPQLWDNDDTIYVSWNCSDSGGSGISGYSYEWSQSSSTTPNNTSQGSATSAMSPSLANASNWYFHVKAQDHAGNWSSTKHYGPFCIDDAVPGIPSIVSCSHTPELWNNDDTIYASWNCSDTGGSGVSGYSYEWSQSSTTTPNNTSQGSATSTTSPALSTASNWYFHVKAVDQAGNWGNTLHYGPFYIDVIAPVAPSIVSCSHTPGVWSNDSTIYISWNCLGIGISGYSYEWSQSSSTTPNNISQGSVTSTTSPALSTASNWYFHVKAVDQAGNWGNTKHFGPFYIDDIAPAVPSIVNCSHTPEVLSNDNTIYISWNCLGIGISGYSYEWSQSSSTTPNTTSQGSATSTTSPQLSTSNDWYFHVRAVDQAGNWGNTLHHGPFYINSPGGLMYPDNVAITKYGSGIIIQWDAVAGASSYRIEASNNPNTGFSQIATVSGTTCITSLTEARRFYRIIAIQ